MAQTHEFYRLHGTRGVLFKTMFIDSGKVDKKIGFPISQIHNTELVTLYDKYLLLRAKAKGNRMSKRELEIYMACIEQYKSELPKFHKQKVWAEPIS